MKKSIRDMNMNVDNKILTCLSCGKKNKKLNRCCRTCSRCKRKPRSCSLIEEMMPLMCDNELMKSIEELLLNEDKS